jgi:hypothetical protein
MLCKDCDTQLRVHVNVTFLWKREVKRERGQEREKGEEEDEEEGEEDMWNQFILDQVQKCTFPGTVGPNL